MNILRYNAVLENLICNNFLLKRNIEKKEINEIIRGKQDVNENKKSEKLPNFFSIDKKPFS